MSLKDRVSKIDFSALPVAKADPLAPLPHDGPSRTAPGAMVAMANDRRSEMLKENERLKELVGTTEAVRGQLNEALGELRQWDGARATRRIDPNRIRLSKYANRDAAEFQTKEFKELRKEIREAGGNVQPIKVRAIKGEDGEDWYELVYGMRRRQASIEEGLMVNALVDNIDDQTLFIEMDRENRNRKDLSAWEQGRSYRRALDEGLFASNRKLSEALGVDLGHVGKALSLADLPQEVVKAFVSPLEIVFRMAKPLKDAVEEDEKRVLQIARELAQTTPRLRTTEVFARLTAPANGRAQKASSPVEVNGKEVARISYSNRGAARIDIDAGVLPEGRRKALANLISSFLKKESTDKS